MIRQIVLSHSIFFVSFRTNSPTYRPAEKHFEFLRNCFHKFSLRLSDHRPVRKNADNADPVFLRRSTSSAASRTPASLAYSFSKTDRPCAGIFSSLRLASVRRIKILFFYGDFSISFPAPAGPALLWIFLHFHISSQCPDRAGNRAGKIVPHSWKTVPFSL